MDSWIHATLTRSTGTRLLSEQIEWAEHYPFGSLLNEDPIGTTRAGCLHSNWQNGTAHVCGSGAAQ